MRNPASPLERAIALTSVAAVAEICGVSPQAVFRWRRWGHLPSTDFVGRTQYAAAIERLTDGQVTKADLLTPPVAEAG